MEKNRVLKVAINGICSGAKSINACVPQESILGPVLYIISIDDMPDKIHNRVVLSADDSIVVAIPSSNIAGHKKTFLSTASRLWNELPEEMVTFRERYHFKKELSQSIPGCLASTPSLGVVRDSCSVNEEGYVGKRELLSQNRRSLVSKGQNIMRKLNLNAISMAISFCQA